MNGAFEKSPWHPRGLGIVAMVGFCVRVAAANDTVLTQVNDRVSGLDPAQAAAVSSGRVVGLLYERLLTYAPDARPYRLQPGLASALPDVDADGVVYTFRLRDDAFFAPDPCFGLNGDGRPQARRVVADDVVYSLKRLADPRIASPGAWTVIERIAGMDTFRARCRGEVDIRELDVSGLRTFDDITVQITLTAPSPQLPWILAMPYTSIVPHEAVRHYGDAFHRHAVGSGPYRLSSWRRNHAMTLVRRNDWSGWATMAPATHGKPYDRLVFLVMDDPVTEWLAFLSGMLDIQRGVARDNWDAVVDESGTLRPELSQRGIRMQPREALDVAYIGFNFRDPLLGNNRALRAAMLCAFDRPTWERFHYHRVRGAIGPIPPGVPGRMTEAHAIYTFDLDRARALMVDAGFPGGIDPETGMRLELQLDIGRTDADTRESTDLLVSFMARIGIAIRPNYSNWPTFLARVSRGDTQMFRLMWLADYPDAENFLQLFYGPNASPGPNRVNYRNPEYDRLYDASRMERDPARREALFMDLQKIIAHDVPWLWMHHRVNTSLSYEFVGGYEPHDFPYGMETFLRMQAVREDRQP